MRQAGKRGSDSACFMDHELCLQAVDPGLTSNQILTSFISNISAGSVSSCEISKQRALFLV